MGSLSFKENEMKQATANKLNKIERECIKIRNKVLTLNDIIINERDQFGETDYVAEIGIPLSNLIEVESVLLAIENFRKTDKIINIQKSDGIKHYIETHKIKGGWYSSFERFIELACNKFLSGDWGNTTEDGIDANDYNRILIDNQSNENAIIVGRYNFSGLMLPPNSIGEGLYSHADIYIIETPKNIRIMFADEFTGK